MIIGNGLIARQFDGWERDENVIIFASGVSNSKETDPASYRREQELLEAQMPTESLLVYFSTCSVYDQHLKDSAYIRHKLFLESLIQENFSNHLIVRLPNVVGRTENPHTFFNFFVDSILDGRPLEIQANSIRYFLDAASIEPVIKHVYSNPELWNQIMNVVFDDPVSVPDALMMMEEEIGMKANASSVNEGYSYSVPDGAFGNIKTQIFGGINDKEYTRNCFAKYIQQRIQAKK